MQDRMNFRPVSPSIPLKPGERLRELLLAAGKASPFGASPFGGEACASTALKPGATPSVAAGSERNLVTGRPGSGGRPFCAASYLTRTKALLHDPSASADARGFCRLQLSCGRALPNTRSGTNPSALNGLLGEV